MEIIIAHFYILQAINDDINNQKVKAREFITKGKKLLRESSFEDDPQLRERVEHLKHKVDAVGKLGVDRLSQLEQTLPLAKAFYDTHQDLATWFDEVDPILAGLDVMSIDADHVKKQQDQVKVCYYRGTVGATRSSHGIIVLIIGAQ